MVVDWRQIAPAALAFFTLFGLTGCESSETIAPSGSTITVAATPATVVLDPLDPCEGRLGVTDCGTSRITATVRSELGVPLPGQDVRFRGSAGFLFTGDLLKSPADAANLPISTDDLGNAEVQVLTAITTTVTATSGNASGTITLTTAMGNLSSITVNIDNDSCSGTSTDVDDCDDTICLIVRAQDTAGDGVNGVVILFELQNNTVGDNTFDGTFSNQQISTTTLKDSAGVEIKGAARTVFRPGSNCDAECNQTNNGGTPCDAEIVALTQSGLRSTGLPLLINIDN